MKIFYSGEGSRSNPEIILREKANLMLTFFDCFQRGNHPTKRFHKIIRARKMRDWYTKEEISRFNSKVTKRGIDDCWEWSGPPNNKGYGEINIRKDIQYAHRMALALKLQRPLKSGECSLHECDNPICVNPKHLFLGTKADNTKDMIAKGRCSAGQVHPISKLVNYEAREVRKLYATGNFTQVQLAQRFNLDQSAISRIIHNQRYKEQTE